MTLKQIKEYYQVESHGSRHDLYDLNADDGLYFPHPYLCSIERNSRGNWRIVSQVKYHKTMESLNQAIKAHVEALPFRSEFYSPRLRKGVFEEMAINEYLSNFDCYDQFNDVITLPNIYNLKEQKFHLSTNLKDYEAQTIELSLSSANEDYSFSQVRVEVQRDATKIIEAIDSLLKPFFLANAVQSFNIAKQMNSMATNIMKVDVNGLQATYEDYNSKLIEELESMLKVLKNE